MTVSYSIARLGAPGGDEVPPVPTRVLTVRPFPEERSEAQPNE